MHYIESFVYLFMPIGAHKNLQKMKTLKQVSTITILKVNSVTKTGIVHATIIDSGNGTNASSRYPIGSKTKLTTQAVEGGKYIVID